MLKVLWIIGEVKKQLQASLASNMEKAINARESVASRKHLRMEALSDDEVYSQGAKQTQLHPSVSAPPSRVRKGVRKTTCAVLIEDCEGWWSSSCHGSVAEHWQLKPEVSWV